MYTSQYSQAVEERLTRRLAIEQAKGDGASAAIVRETTEALEGQYCPDCYMHDDGDEHRCPTCGRVVPADEVWAVYDPKAHTLPPPSPEILRALEALDA